MLTPRGSKAGLWVVDLYVPESIDEVIGRLREIRALMPNGSAAALYGFAQPMRPAFGQIPSGPIAMVPDEVAGRDPSIPDEQGPSTDGETASDDSQGGSGARSAVPEPALDDGDFGGEAEDVEGEVVPELDAEALAAAEEAAGFVVQLGKDKQGNWAHGLTLAQIAAADGDKPVWFFGWALRQRAPAKLVLSAFAYARVHYPFLYETAIAERQSQS